MLFALSTGHKIGLALVAGLFIVFALTSALVIPRYRPQFPGRGGLPVFLVLTAGLFVGTLVAVTFFGRESEKASAGETAPAATTTVPAPASTTAATGAELKRGKGLYESLGCGACHSLDGSKSVGPTWKGLAGSQVKLAGGQTVTADDAYLLESIEDPDKQLVSGYQTGTMSAAIRPGQVSKADASALAAFIDSVG